MLDAISEERLALVHPELSRRIHQLADLLSFTIRVVQGLRTFAEQNALYAQGRTTPGRIVTDARAGYSAHNFGYAVDVCPMLMNVPDWNIDTPEWEELLEKAPSCGLAEGAKWCDHQGRPTPDNPHLYPQECPASPDDEMRLLFTDGEIEAVWAYILPS